LLHSLVVNSLQKKRQDYYVMCLHIRSTSNQHNTSKFNGLTKNSISIQHLLIILQTPRCHWFIP